MYEGRIHASNRLVGGVEKLRRHITPLLRCYNSFFALGVLLRHIFTNSFILHMTLRWFPNLRLHWRGGFNYYWMRGSTRMTTIYKMTFLLRRFSSEYCTILKRCFRVLAVVLVVIVIALATLLTMI